MFWFHWNAELFTGPFSACRRTSISFHLKLEGMIFFSVCVSGCFLSSHLDSPTSCELIEDVQLFWETFTKCWENVLDTLLSTSWKCLYDFTMCKTWSITWQPLQVQQGLWTRSVSSFLVSLQFFCLLAIRKHAVRTLTTSQIFDDSLYRSIAHACQKNGTRLSNVKPSGRFIN